MIDRIGPTERPNAPVRGYQRWRQLGFFHWEVPESALRELVPPSLQIDTYEGKAFVGLVPFEMLGVRPRWVPEALAFDFLETNVRTYVHVDGRDPGVFFFSLDAASRIAVKAARWGWGLPYFHAAMDLQRQGDLIDYRVDRRTADRPSLRIRWKIGEHLGASPPDTLEHFLAERYLLHVEWRGQLYTGQVHHPPYPLQRAEVLDCEDGLVPASGLRLTGPPQLAHYAEGVDVDIFDLAPRND